ncbi:hypothetical protein NDU88_005289 [Pleurodeles waltl]|uniref:Uncharacterized protein n=1 Tax=Pleurodeles waltl TaxID=8319 RepID=A0AAV7RJR4_PLEWA|nr:hypothetical protein NDU88_005289 [Pleurodeles waltl]
MRSVRSLCPPRCFTYFARALPRRQSPASPSTSVPGSHQHCVLSLCLDVPVSCKGGTQYGFCGAASGPGTPRQVPWGCALLLGPRSPASLPRGCRARTVTAGGLRTPPRPQRTRALYPMHCSVFSARPGRDRPSTYSTSPLGPCSVPRSLFPSVTSSLWVPGPHRHRRRTAHSATPSAHTGALSDALQRVLCASPRPRRRPRAPWYRLQQGPLRSGI